MRERDTKRKNKDTIPDNLRQERDKLYMDKLYMDDTFGVLRQNAEKNAYVKHTTCLAAVGPRLKFTCEIEENKEYRSYH